ncbi:hypothetical protein [Pedobacter alpinus]|uniref:MetA-pathway of phenol degradation n=1 Tax=Pedobacter alpinus TaxID=1590643 RepID=A0ABW5TPN8_9SPHI
MKKIILLTFCLVCTLSILKAQTLNNKPRYLKYATLVSPVDITKYYGEQGLIGGNKATISLIKDTVIVKEDGKVETVEVRKILTDTILIRSILIEKNYAFDVIEQIGSYSMIKFWDLSNSNAKSLLERMNSNKANSRKNFKELKTDENPKILNINGLMAITSSDTIDLSKSYYLVPTKTLLNNSIEFDNKSGLWNIGLLVMPIKLRPFATEKGQFDFASGISVGPTFSWTVHHNWKTNFTHNFLAYIGLSSYTADESKIKVQRDDYKLSMFSPAVGWMWEKNNVQLSFLVGVDFPGGSIQQNWVYRNQPWFGIGLGISLFKINSDETNTAGKN